MARDVFELRPSRPCGYNRYRRVSVQAYLDDIAEPRRDISSVLRRNNRGFVMYLNRPDRLGVQGVQAALIPTEIGSEKHRQFRGVRDPLFPPRRVAAPEPRLRGAVNTASACTWAGSRCGWRSPSSTGASRSSPSTRVGSRRDALGCRGVSRMCTSYFRPGGGKERSRP